MTRAGTKAAVGYSVSHRLVAWVSRNLLGNLEYTVRHGLTKGLKRQGGLGFLPAWTASESAETRFLSSLELAGQVVYDIGAYEGLLTLFFASRAAKVVAFEPNPTTLKRLRRNLELNDFTNVLVVPMGVGAKAATLELTYDSLMTGGASADPSISAALRTVAPHTQTVLIPVDRLDTLLRTLSLPAPHLVKVDVEGMELEVLQGATGLLHHHRPALYIELHGSSPEEKQSRAYALREFLAAQGYSSIYHVESEGREDRPIEGHLYCRVLGVSGAPQ